MIDPEDRSTDRSRPVVVLTRADEDNLRLADKLDGHGLAALSMPMIEVEAPADKGNALVAAAANLDLYHWVVLTSANGVRAMARALERVGDSDESTRWPPHVSLAVVGPATEAAAGDQGWPVSFVPSKATAADLVEQFPAPDTHPVAGPPRVLAALAELAAPTVAKGLRARGYQVDQVVAYRTSAPAGIADRIEDARVRADVAAADAVAFTSPSTVERFVARFGHTAVPPIVICIGPRTAVRARALAIEVTMVAEPHSEAGLLAALVQVLDGR